MFLHMDCEELIWCHDYSEALGVMIISDKQKQRGKMRMRNKGFFVLLLNREYVVSLIVFIKV